MKQDVILFEEAVEQALVEADKEQARLEYKKVKIKWIKLEFD